MKKRYFFNHNFLIDNKKVGLNCPVFIIAEAGIAHFGNIEKAKRLVDMAVNAGADAVKFQIYKTEELISKEAPEWYKRFKSKELKYKDFEEIKNYCISKNIIFLATAHDEKSLDFLKTLEVPAYKIGSGEVSNWIFIEKIAKQKKPIIISTGMYTLKDIGKVLHIIKNAGNPNIAVLHCVTSYPTPPSEVNLRAMDTIRNTYDVLVGYSDHTEGFHFSLAAVARGACIIEKHITLDFNVPDAQDWKVSCGPEDFPKMVRQIREIEAGLGSGTKIPTEKEKLNIRWARKSLVAKVDIYEGEILNIDKITAKRPGTGISPSEIEKVIGKKAKRTIKKDTQIRKEDLI